MECSPLLGDFGGRVGIFNIYRALLPLEYSPLSLFVALFFASNVRRV